jgi:hypothetical protein
MTKGGFHPIARAATLAEEGKVHEWSGVQEYERPDSIRDRIARAAFGLLTRLQAGQAVTRGELSQIVAAEQTFWNADRTADDSVVAHTLEGVDLFDELGALLGGAAPA